MVLRGKRLSFQTKISDIHFTITSSKEDWLARVDDVLQTLLSGKPLSIAAVQRLREEIKLETTYDSNAIEGSTLTLRETVLVVKEGVDCFPGKPIRDVMAARGFASGFNAIFPFVEDRIPLTFSLISEFHKYVMLGALPEFCGVFRNHNVQILGTRCRTAQFWEFPNEFKSWSTGTTPPTRRCIPSRRPRTFMRLSKRSTRSATETGGRGVSC